MPFSIRVHFTCLHVTIEWIKPRDKKADFGGKRECMLV